MEYYHLPLYRMPISIQKQWIQVIQQTKNGVVLTIVPLGELDFEMVTSVNEFQFLFPVSKSLFNKIQKINLFRNVTHFLLLQIVCRSRKTLVLPSYQLKKMYGNFDISSFSRFLTHIPPIFTIKYFNPYLNLDLFKNYRHFHFELDLLEIYRSIN